MQRLKGQGDAVLHPEIIYLIEVWAKFFYQFFTIFRVSDAKKTPDHPPSGVRWIVNQGLNYILLLRERRKTEVGWVFFHPGHPKSFLAELWTRPKLKELCIYPQCGGYQPNNPPFSRSYQ